MNSLLWLLERPFIIWILETKLVSRMLGWILKRWELNDPLPDDPNIIQFIFLISYAATPTRLTNGSLVTTYVARDLAEKFSKAWIIGGEFRDNPLNSNEWDKKLSILPPERSINGGAVSSSIDEQQAMALAALSKAGTIDHAIVVAEGAHSRRDAFVWRHYLPKSQIYFRSVSAKVAADLKNPMAAQRRWQVWLMANIIAMPLFKWWPGVERIAKSNPSQPVS